MTAAADPRRRRDFLLTGVCALFASRLSRAESSAVPADIQAALLAKLARYDRNFPARAGDVVHVLLVVKTGSARSEVSAAEMKSALSRIDRIGGLPHRETVSSYPGASKLAERCRAERVAIVYLAPGLDGDLGEIKTALSSLDVLSVAAVPDQVPQGVVLGFELASGAPKLLFNLNQARAQHVDFPADVLRLMKVFR
jgi:hypothetical protein